MWKNCLEVTSHLVQVSSDLFLTASSSKIIDNLIEYCKPRTNVRVAYWYFQFSSAATQDIARMLRSLFRQLVCSPLPDKVQKLWDNHQQNHTEPSHSELLDAISDSITAHAQVFLVLDVLDECPEDNPFGRSTLLELITQLMKMHPRCLHLVVTSRREPDIRKTLQLVASFSIDVDRALDEDVRKFINHALNHELIKRWGSKLMSLATKKLLESEER
jgi:hypothetical protein